jgi:hypothetical protein
LCGLISGKNREAVPDSIKIQISLQDSLQIQKTTVGNFDFFLQKSITFDREIRF